MKQGRGAKKNDKGKKRSSQNRESSKTEQSSLDAKQVEGAEPTLNQPLNQPLNLWSNLWSNLWLKPRFFGNLFSCSQPSSGRWRWEFLVLLILLVGFFLRTFDLDMKPPHFDEGINGFFVSKMWKDGFYRYDPTNFHGPLYFYILLVAEILLGRTVFAYRFVTALISVASLALIAKHRRYFGRAAIWAAGMCALSAGFVFYARYAIHESLFVFFELLFSYGWFTWRSERSRRAVAMLAVAFFGLYAVKETYFIFVGTWLIAVGIDEVVRRKFKFAQEAQETPRASGTGYWHQPASRTDWLAMIGMGLLFESALYSGFFINMRGMRDMVESVLFWTRTGGGGKSGHEKPMIYWLELLTIYEWPSLVSLALGLPLLVFARSRLRIMILVALGLFAAYSLIPYKTPWLILNLIWPLAFVFGALIDGCGQLRWRLARLAGYALMLALVVVMVRSMLRVNFVNYANEKERYVYVQTTLQMKQVLDEIESRVQSFPEDLNMRVLVLVKDPWPLPWVFGMYPNLAYGKPASAELKSADVMLIDGIDRAALEARAQGKYWRVPFQIRDSYEKGWAYLDFEKFKSTVPSDSEIFVGQAVQK